MDTRTKNEYILGGLAGFSVISFITHLFFGIGKHDLFSLIGLLLLIAFVAQGLTWKIEQMEKEVKTLKESDKNV